jgi:hypothetical protein
MERGPGVRLIENGAIMSILNTLLRKLFSRENTFALLLCLIIIFVIILTASASPQWIYQGF